MLIGLAAKDAILIVELEVLTNETNSFNADLGLAQARLNELLSLVEIYRNLGGGWDL